MRIAVFFVCLYYLLTGGYNYVGAAAPYTSNSYARQELPKQQKFLTRGQVQATFSDISKGSEDKYLPGEKIEDEDVTNFTTGKQKLLARYCFLLSFLFLLNYLYKRRKELPRFYVYTSPKYITQRVLRI